MGIVEDALDKQSCIAQRVQEHREELDRLHGELFGLARGFSSYKELYTFVRMSTKTVEEFNLAMLQARPAFLDRDTSVILF